MTTTINTKTKRRGRTRHAAPRGVTFHLRRNSDLPLYEQVQSVIAEHISKGRLREGDQLPSLQQLSEEMGIAYATVARGVRALVQSGALEAHAGSGTAVAAPSKRILRRTDDYSSFTAATGFVGFIGRNTDNEQHDYHYLSLVSGIETVAIEEEKRLVLLSRRSQFGWDKVEGMLIQDAQPQCIVDDLPRGLPCVCLLRAPEGVAGVVTDDYNGARLGVRRLAELGHRRIGYLIQRSAASTIPSLRQRLNGFHDALHDAGIKSQERWIHNFEHAEGNYLDWGYQSMNGWLQNGFAQLGCTALFAQNDLVAIGAIRALKETGLRVPDDVSVLGYDGTLACQLFSPTIASVAVPLRQIGARAMELLSRQIQSGETSNETIVLPAEFLPGESVAPAP
jgi:LacI family transcriptional regulator